MRGCAEAAKVGVNCLGKDFGDDTGADGLASLTEGEASDRSAGRH